jgi:hypothetical protein
VAARVSRRLCLFTAFMVALASVVHAILHPARLDEETFRLQQFLVMYLIAVWLVSDPKLPKAERPSFDHAYLHMTFFPFTPLYEQVRTHGWKGVARVFGLVLLVVFTYGAEVIAGF